MRTSLPVKLLFLVDRVEVAAHQLVHLEHVYFLVLKYGSHLLVAEDLALIIRVLEVLGFDVLPQLLHDLRSRQLGAS